MSDKNKATDKKLQESEEKFRLAFENANDAILWGDPKTGLIINCNKAAEKLLEKNREELIGQHQTVIHPPKKAGYYSQLFKKHIEQNGAVDEEAEIITKSGKIKPVHITASVTLIGGKPTIQGIFRDITEWKNAERALKQSEEKYRNLFNNMLIPVFLTDPQDFKILDVNPAGEKLFGYTKEEFKNLTLHDLWAREETKSALKNISEILKKKKEIIAERMLRRKDGKRITVEVSASITNYGGKKCLLGVLRDLTPLKKVEEKMHIIEKKKLPLTDIEKKVLFGLVAFPQLNDRELSGKLNIKLSTITAARRRLFLENYYKTIVVPNLSVLGVTSLDFTNPTNNPFQFFWLTTNSMSLAMDVSLERFKLKQTKLYSFFDFFPCLKKIFGLDLKTERQEFKYSEGVKIRKNDKKVLLGLIEYPGFTESDLAQKLNLSRPTVSSIKKMLFKLDFARKLNIPNFRKLNQELLIFYRLRFNSEMNGGTLQKNLDLIHYTFNPFLALNQDNVETGLFLFKSYYDYKFMHKKVIQRLVEDNVLLPDSEVQHFLINEVKNMNMDFLPLTRELLKIK